MRLRHAIVTQRSLTGPAAWLRNPAPKIMSTRILIADDEDDVRELVARQLKAAGYTAILAADGAEAIEKARKEKPALLVLDIMMPGMTGIDACKAMRGDSLTARMPILFLTAKTDEIDRVLGLELGADDYMTKPFSPRELILRIKAILRRMAGPDEGDILRIGDITIDRTRHTVRVKSKALELTATEFKLLSLLLERRGRVQSRERLLSDVWGYDSYIDTRTVDTHVRRLREKLGSAADAIETVRGFGYRVSEE
jgi:two-component system phosphate regulon response regulator PhoB